MLNCPKQSTLKVIKRLTEEDLGIELQSSNAFWWHSALSFLAMYHAMLARAHRLQTRCREARLRSAAAPPICTACPLCKAQVDDEDHAVAGTCTGENVITLIRQGHDHAVKSTWSAVRAGDLGGFPMWTGVETRSKTAIARDGARTRRLPNFLLPHAAQHSIPDMAIMVISDDFVFKHCQGNAVTRRQWNPQAHPWERNRGYYSKVTIHLLEVKYTCDLRVHDMVEPALQASPCLADWHMASIGSAPSGDGS